MTIKFWFCFRVNCKAKVQSVFLPERKLVLHVFGTECVFSWARWKGSQGMWGDLKSPQKTKHFWSSASKMY